MTPNVFDGALPADLYGKLRAYIQAMPMTYGSKSNRNTDPHGHWSWKPFHDRSENLADLGDLLPVELRKAWDILQNNFSLAMKLVRCYANGYTYGTDGYFHTDSDRAGDVTIIVNICNDWQLDWGGETVVTVGGQYYSFIPRPNRALFVPSNAPHAARAVSRKCQTLRTTLMFKARPARSKEFEELSQFLVISGALKHDHANGTLHDHLVRVYQLLEDRKLPRRVCVAGGLHSYYGTNAYHSQLRPADPAYRAGMAAAWGQDIENLVYLFSIIDRPKTLESTQAWGDNGGALKLVFEDTKIVDTKTLSDLRWIECANLADQNALGRWPNLKAMWEPSKHEGNMVGLVLRSDVPAGGGAGVAAGST